MSACLIRAVNTADAAAICAIYNHYVENTTITFEEDQVSTDQMQKRIALSQASLYPWLVATDLQHQVIGYAYATQWKARSAYRFSVEITIYLHPSAQKQGLGWQLYQHLFDLMRERGYHLAIAGITLPNEASIALHEKLGMQKIGHFHQVGWKFGQWLDVGYWQLVLSR